MVINARSLIKESWSLYRTNFLLLLKIVAWLFVPTLVATLISITGLNPAILVPINIIISLAALVLSIFISTALIIAINSLAKKEKIDLKNIYNLSYSKIASVLWVTILSFVVALGIILLSAVPFLIGLLLQTWLPSQNIIMIICAILSVVLAIASTIAIFVWLSFSVFFVVLEDVRGSRALFRSKALTEGRFGKILWRWFASYFVYGLILTIVVLIPIYLIGFAIGNPNAGFTEIPPWWSSLISNVIYTITVPIFTIIGVLLYNSLKKEK